MANSYIDRLVNPASTMITENPIGRAGINKPRPAWSAALDKKYGTSLMGEEGISRANGASVLNNMSGQYADSVRTNAPIVTRNANTRGEAMSGLLTQAQQSSQPQQQIDRPQEQLRASIRQRRSSPARHQVGGQGGTQQ